MTDIAPKRLPITLWALGALFLLAGITATGLLSADALNIGGKIPGCAEDGGCSAAADSRFGSIPFTDNEQHRFVPVSLLGFAFVLSMLTVWVVSLFRGMSAIVPALAAAGAAVSIFYLALLYTNRDEYFCHYCLISHIANLCFLAVTAVATRWRLPSLGGSFRAVAAAAIAFLVAGGALTGTYRAVAVQHDAELQRQADEDINDILAGFGLSPEDNTATEDDPAVVANPQQAPPEPEPEDTTRSLEEILAQDTAYTGIGFAGRYIVGPEQAHLRVVMVSSYQCPSCIEKAAEIARVMQVHPERVNLSVIHWPLTQGCNPHMGDRNPQPYACLASRAAEAAGILGGPEAFKAVSDVLYTQMGELRNNPSVNTWSQTSLHPVVDELGLDREEFFRVMHSDLVLDRIRGDIDYAKDHLGVFQTPTIYINGTEFRPWQRPNAVANAMVQLLSRTQNAAMGTNAIDQPPRAIDKWVDEFFQGRLARVDFTPRLARPQANRVGPDDAPIVLTITGPVIREFTHSLTSNLTTAIASLPDDFPAIRFEYRHDPLHSDCDDGLRQQLEQARANARAQGRDPSQIAEFVRAESCDIHFTLEAIGQLTGGEAFQRAWNHAAEQHEDITADELAAFAVAELGVDAGALAELVADPQVRREVAIEGATSRGQGNGSPVLYINGRYVPPICWRSEPEVIRRILIRVASELPAR